MPQRYLALGELLSGRYRIEKRVADSAMGAVYRAIDTRFNRPCAVKEMLDDFQNETELNQAEEWFRREATLLLDLNHPYIPHVRDFFRVQDKHYLVMDFIEGRTLGEILEKEGNVPGLNKARGVSEDRARSWAQQLCSALGYLHRQARPIIFRDLKPSNIMVTERDEIKLIDFGIARIFQSQRQSITIGYAPPEQLQGMSEPRSDIYALGATLHRLLTHYDATNNTPSIFSFPTVRSLRPDISPAFDQVIMKALAPNLEQRWSNAGEMEQAIINLPSSAAFGTPGSNSPQYASPPQHQPVPSGYQTQREASPGEALIQAAQYHLHTGRFDAAYESIHQAYTVEPNNALVHKIFGQVFARRKPPSPELALQAYNRSLQLNPNDPETYKLIGDIFLYFHKQPAQAIQLYIQSLRLRSNDFEAHQRLAKCYEKTSQLEPALREYQEAARLAPKRPEIHYALGQLAWRLNQLLVAERAFVQLLRINPPDHQTRFLLSQVYEHEGKFEDALRECSYVVGAMPGNSAAQAMLQRLRTQLRPPSVSGTTTSTISSSIGETKPVLSGDEIHLSLFAIVQAELEERDVAFIGKVYSLHTGISQIKPENKSESIQVGPIQIKPEAFDEEPFDFTISSVDKPVSFDILLHTSKNIELITDWQKRLQYDPRDPEPQLVEFRFQGVALGQSFLVIDFYHERRWLRTMRLEFNAVEESQLTTVSTKG